jgi:hypothetical protein
MNNKKLAQLKFLLYICRRNNTTAVLQDGKTRDLSERVVNKQN